MSIQIENLRFSYPRVSGKYASESSTSQPKAFGLAIENWTVEQGDKAVLFGPSGCGKSTLLNLISGSLKASAGTLLVQGKDMCSLSDAERRAHRIQNMGFVFQDFPLVSYLDSIENVLLPYRINPALKLDGDARERAQELLYALGLKERLGSFPDALSQGERQRVALARALVARPKILLADEPTAGLDPERSDAVMNLLEGMVEEKGLTLVMVTHDPSLRGRFQKSMDVSKVQS